MIIWQYFFKNSGFVGISSVDFFNDFSFRVQYPIHYLHCFVLNLTNQFNIFFISQPLVMRSKLVLSLFSINSRHYFSLMATFVLVKCTPFFHTVYPLYLLHSLLTKFYYVFMLLYQMNTNIFEMAQPLFKIFLYVFFHVWFSLNDCLFYCNLLQGQFLTGLISLTEFFLHEVFMHSELKIIETGIYFLNLSVDDLAHSN